MTGFRAHRAVALVLALTLVAGSSPRIQEDEAEDPERSLDAVEEQISALRGKLEELRNERASVVREFEVADVQLALRRQELARLEQRQRHLTEEIETRTARVEELEAEVEASRRRLASRVVALYRMGPLSYSRLLLTSGSPAELLANYQLVNHLAERDRELILEHRDLHRRLADAVRDAAETREDLQETRRRVDAAVEALERQQQERQRLLGLIDREAQVMRGALEEKQRTAERLEGLVGRLAGTAGEGAAPADPGGAGGAAGRATIQAAKGGLPWPGDGPVVTEFGRRRHPEYDTYTVSKGIEIGAEMGTPVRAVYPGRVVFADWWTGYGLLVIVDHGNDFFTLYGHLSEVTIRVNASVEEGTSIGTVGETGSLDGPSLYFEIRRGTEALNPSGWLRDR